MLNNFYCKLLIKCVKTSYVYVKIEVNKNYFHDIYALYTFFKVA